MEKLLTYPQTHSCKLPDLPFRIIGQFGTADNLAPRTIWHRTIWHRECKADNLAPRTIWHRSVKWTIWHRGQFGTADNLAPRTIWHHRQFGTADNLAPQCKVDNLAPPT